MNKKNYIKKTLSTVIVSACVAVATPVIANSVVSSKNISITTKEQRAGSIVNGEDANYNPNFKVDLSLVGTEENDSVVLVAGTHKNNFPMIGGPTYGNWYHDVVRWEKSYDGGKTYQTIKPNKYDEKKELYSFNREDKNFLLRKSVDWYYNNLDIVTFTTNSKWIEVNKKFSLSVEKVGNPNKPDYRIMLDFLNDGRELVQFSLTREINGQKVVLESSGSVFQEVNKVPWLFEKDEKGRFYFSKLRGIHNELHDKKYTFEIIVKSNDSTTKKGSISFTVDKLSNNFKIIKLTTSNNTNETINLKVDFEKYDIVDDYEISFVEVNSNGEVVENGYVPSFKKLGNYEYQITKDNVERSYKVRITSKKLNANVIGDQIVKVAKKDVTNPTPNPEPTPTPPSQGGDSNNPTLPEDNNGIVNLKQNSTSNISTIAIMATLSLIALIAVVCSIIFFINMKKNNKK